VLDFQSVCEAVAVGIWEEGVSVEFEFGEVGQGVGVWVLFQGGGLIWCASVCGVEEIELLAVAPFPAVGHAVAIVVAWGVATGSAVGRRHI